MSLGKRRSKGTTPRSNLSPGKSCEQDQRSPPRKEALRKLDLSVEGMQGPSMSRRALVVLATYRQLPSLRLVLRGYLRQTIDDFALTVADDGSPPDVAAFLESIRPAFEARGIPFQHVWHEDQGFRKCAILNEAIRQSHGEPLLVFSDGDCIPPAHFVARHLEAHEPRSFHVGGVYRLTEEASAAIDEAAVDAGRFESLGTSIDLRWLRKRRRQSTWGTLLRRRNRPKINGLDFAIDRDLFEAINGFDERFETYYIGEDTDLRDRAMRSRPRPRVKNLYLVNDVYHLWHPSTPQTREASLEYYRQERPVRCGRGLARADG